MATIVGYVSYDEGSSVREIFRTEYSDLAKMYVLSHIHLQTKRAIPVIKEVVDHIFNDRRYRRYDIDISYDGSFVYLTRQSLDKPVIYSLVIFE